MGRYPYQNGIAEFYVASQHNMKVVWRGKDLRPPSHDERRLVINEQSLSSMRVELYS